MKFLILTFCCSLLIIANIVAQNKNKTELPYKEIPDYPETYTPGNVAARMVDGLGFRYYWGTESLREADLKFKPSEEARTTEETLDHIYELSLLIVNSTKKIANIIPMIEEDLSYEEKRRKTLENFKEASEILKKSKAGDMEAYKIVFKREKNISEYPFWQHLNGPIADGNWHVGQIVSFRRSSGNPLNPNVSVFHGKLRD